MPPCIVLVRHAESEHHVRGLTGGWTDTPLTERGHRQAHLVAERLKAELAGIPVRLISSDLLRTRGTAAHIAEALGVQPEFDERLREHNNGEAAGLTWEEASRRWPDPETWPPDHRQFPGSETYREFQARAAAFLASLPDNGPLPVAVTHGGTIDRLIAAWMDIPPEVMSRAGFQCDVTSLTVLVEDQDRVRTRHVTRSNDTRHLDGVEGQVPLVSRR